MKRSLSHIAGAALVAAGAFGAIGVHAAPVFTAADIDFSGGATSFGYLGSQFTFSDVSGGSFDFAPVAVTTGAGAGVTALGAPFYDPPQPTTYFDPIRGSGSLVFDSGYSYSGFTSTPIPFSITPSFIGLALALDDGTHYGYARFAGTQLVSYAFESIAGVGIDAAGAFAAPVPEPETLALMIAGLGLLGLQARRGKRRAARVA